MAALLIAIATPGTASAVSREDADRDKIYDSLSLSGSAPRPVLVALREPATRAKVAAIEADVGALGTNERLRIVEAFTARATPAQIRALAARADVAHVEDDAVAVPFGVTAQRGFGVTQARDDLPDLDGRGLVAAVIDSGIDPSMADFGGGKLLAFKDLVNGRTDPYDAIGHGSLVSDVLAGSGASGPEGRGVAPAAKLVSINVIDDQGQSSLGLIAQGIQWAVDHRAEYGIDAINLSIGDPVGCGDGNDVASKAVDAAVAAGIVVIAAAGNAGPGACTIKSPGAAESAITVGALADPGAGGFSEAWFSSRGPTADGRTKPDVMAPGFNVVIAGPGGGTIVAIGTSAAAPFVTGTALLLLQADPALQPAAVKDVLERTAVDWGRPGRDNDYGSGRLDAYAALAAVGAPLATPPAVPAHRAWSGSLAQGESVSYDVDVAGTGFPLAVTLNAPSAGFGLWLRNSSGAPVGTMTAQPSPSRQGDITVQTPAPGRYTVIVAALSDSGPWALDVSGALAPADATAPELTLDELTRSGVAGAAGGALGDFPGVVVRVSQGDTEVRRIGVAPVLGRWSAPLALPDGTYTVTAEQGDASGNVMRTAPRTLLVDTVAPTVTVAGTPDAFSFSASEAGATLECRLDGGAWAACAAAYTGLPAGTHALDARATDASGNVGPSARREWVVAAPPTPTPTPDLTVTPTPTPDATATPTPTPEATASPRRSASPAPTATAVASPVLSLVVGRQRLATVLKSGLALRVGCTARCSTTLTVTQGKKVVGRRTITVSGPATTKVGLTAAAKRALKRARRATFTVTASTPGAKPVSVTSRVASK